MSIRTHESKTQVSFKSGVAALDRRSTPPSASALTRPQLAH